MFKSLAPNRNCGQKQSEAKCFAELEKL